MDVTQASLWNGAAGSAWVDNQELLDHMFKPFQDLLVKAVCEGPGDRVLDVGCGTGSTTLAVAKSFPTGGSCTGIDISEPMIVAARIRAQREDSLARFLIADAQSYPFEPASFDTILSRFGVMFFEDSIQAFANLRRAATNSARMCILAWRSAAQNPFMTTAERAAAPFLTNLPERRRNGPGQFAFADPQRVETILNESGWSGIDIRPIDVVCTLPKTELVRYLTRLGPVGLVLQEADDRLRTRVIETVRAAFDPYVHGTEVRYTASCWMVKAKRREALNRYSQAGLRSPEESLV